MVNNFFKVIEALKDIQVPNTRYLLKDSGLVSELCIVGLEFEIVKIKFTAIDASRPSWELLNQAINDKLLKIDGIQEVRIRCKEEDTLDQCPKEIQQLY